MRACGDRPVVGVFVFEESWRSWNQDDLAEACLTFRECGVNRFITETWEPGQDLIDTAHRHGMDFWISVSCFSDHVTPIRESRPELTPITAAGTPREQQEWYVGLIPTDERYNNALVRRCAELAATFDIDGFALDFMRWPLHWELELRPQALPVETSFDPLTIGQFRLFDPDMPARRVGAEAATEILNRRLDKWIAFKCNVITTLVARIHNALAASRPGLSTGVFVVPGDEETRRRFVGQDVHALGEIVDELLPMTYHRIVERDIGWIEDTVLGIRSVAPGSRITPVLQVTSHPCFSGDSDWGAPMEPDEARAALVSGRSAASAGGVVVFPGEALLRGRHAEKLRKVVRQFAGDTGMG